MAKKSPTSGAVSPELPSGVKLVRTLRGHTQEIGRIAWSPDGRVLASPSADRTIRLWDVETEKCLRTLAGSGRYNSVAFDPGGHTLASGNSEGAIILWEVASGNRQKSLKSQGNEVFGIAFNSTGDVIASSSGRSVKLWEVASGGLLNSLEGHTNDVWGIAFAPQGGKLVSGSWDTTVRLWTVPGGTTLQQLKGHSGGYVHSVAFHADGSTVASAGNDSTIKYWDSETGRMLRSLEGHTGGPGCLAFWAPGRLMASKCNDGTVRVWDSDAGGVLAVIPERSATGGFRPGLAFHPRLPLLAAVGSEPDAPQGKRDCVIHIYELDLAVLLGQPPDASASHYVNAKVVLLGDTGVGKSGLSLVLNGQPFEATDSTAGRKVWTFQSQDVALDKHLKQTRETLLWDLAGQPGYRVIHQLHLNEVAVALVLFDARSEIDPLAGVRHWGRALHLAVQRQGSSCVPLKKFLVSARTDRGTVSVSKDRLEALSQEFGFDGYFETSAKEGWQVPELRRAIEQAIPWGDLPVVTSSVLFADIKAFLLRIKKTGRLLAPAGQLYDEFALARPDAAAKEPNLPAQFDTCISRLENRDLIRRLSFGGYVLLQPELLDAYASAMVNAAKKEPDGLGSLAEDVALGGQFYVPDEHKVKDKGQEQLLLHATVEELARHDLALRESASDGRYLVFPSEFIRDYEAAPDPTGKAVAVTFDGPAQSLYSTLVVRLGHSGLFTTGRAEMWRNAAVFTAKAGGKCGLYLHEFAEARGRLVVFYDRHDGRPASDETRFHFEEFVLAHAERRALKDTVGMVRFFVCASCGDPVPDSYVKRLRERGLTEFDCPCEARVSLTEPKERLRFPSKVEAMERSADRQRDFEVFVESARGETSTPDFRAWAGGDRVTLAIVFTDVVGSTALGEELRDEGMSAVRRAHFAQSRKLIGQYKGREIKTIGDSFMAAFRSAEQALDYARALQADPGHPQLRVRAGVHIGPVDVEENDVFGGAVNFAARVVGAIADAEIWVSERAKEDLDRSRPKLPAGLAWERHDRVPLKGFVEPVTLWSLGVRFGSGLEASGQIGYPFQT